MNSKRRTFLKSAVGVAAISGIALKDVVQNALGQTSGGEEYAHHWVMVHDQNKCIGCNYCTWACKATNDTPADIYWNLVFKEKETTSGSVFLTRVCMHCEEPPCVMACPVVATYKRPEDGIVVMNYDKCVGCRYCIAACPYGARYFNWRENKEPNIYAPEWGTPEVPRRVKGVAEKCTFCIQRIDKALQTGLKPGIDPEVTPACVNICPTGAKAFGDLNDKVQFQHPNKGTLPSSIILSEGRVLLEQLGTKPRVYYLPNKRQ